MKTILTNLLIFLIPMMLLAEQKDIYIVDFHNDKSYNSILGNNVANEFERALTLCKNKYRVIPRMKYERQLKGETFEGTKRFLQKEGIDYIIYGNIYNDDITNLYTIEYIFEELNTHSIILIENINFKELNTLINSNERYKSIEDRLKNDEELCKKFSLKRGKQGIIDEDAVAKADIGKGGEAPDDDGDGVPNVLDKQPNTPLGAIVDIRGVEIKKGDNNGNWSSIEKQAVIKIIKMLPDLPNIPFDDGKIELNDDAKMKIDQMANVMKMYPIIVVNLIGQDTADETLASKRSKVIKDFLMKNYKLPERRFVTSSKVETTAKALVETTLAFDKMEI